MNKQEFFGKIRARLSAFPQDDIDERLTFYNEMIDDRIEEGLSEENAVSKIGTVDEVVSQIVAETPFSKLVKEKVKQRRSLRAWEIVLIILGCPIWLSLLIAVVAVIFSVYVTVWAVIISLWAVVVSLAACSLGGVVSAVFFAVGGNALTAAAMLSMGAVCAGLTIFSFFGCKAVTKGVFLLTKKMASGIKSIFVGKENVI